MRQTLATCNPEAGNVKKTSRKKMESTIDNKHDINEDVHDV